MKNLSLFLFLIVFSSSLNAQNFSKKSIVDSSGVISDTLVAYYPFSGGAIDSSGFGNDGEVFGASLTSDRFGNANSAYEFDGVDDYMEIEHDSVFISNVKTVEFWFRKKSITINSSDNNLYVEGLIWKSFDTSLNRDFSFSITNQNEPFDFYNTIGNNTSNLLQSRIQESVGSFKWHHIVGVIDSSKILTYLDGILVSSIENPGDLVNSNAPVIVGKASESSFQNRYFEGVIDDVKIFNYEVDSTYVWKSYTKGGWPIVSEDTLVAHYPFSGNTIDSSDFGNDGEVFGAMLTTDRFGNPNSAYEFDGINDFIRVSDADQLTPSNSRLSISVWFKTKFPGDRFILYKGSSSTNREYASGVRADSLGSFQINENGSATNRDWVVTKNVIEENVWQHLVGVWDSSTVKIYLNNRLESVDSTDLTISNFTSDLFIGTYGGAISQYAFDGKIDDLKIFNVGLDSLAVSRLFHDRGWPATFADTLEIIPDTLIAHYPFNGSANDLSGFGNDGDVFGASLTADRFGNANSAYEFDGVDDYLEIAHKSAFNSDTRSVEFWFKKTNNTISDSYVESFLEGIVWKSFDTDLNRDYSFSIGNQNQPFDLYNKIGNNTPDFLEVSVEKAINNSRWYHVVGIMDSSKTSIFLNGELKSTKENPGDIVFSGAPIVIGKASISSIEDRYFKGVIDDVKFFNYEVDNSYVWESYTKGGWPFASSLDSTGVAADTLVAHYKFNGNAADSSGFGNDGEVVGATLAADRFGNLNEAYVFDGDDYINFSSSDSIEFGKKDFSFSLWFRAVNDDRAQYQILRKGNDHATLNEARWAIELIEDGKLRVIFEDAENEFNTLVANGQNQFLDEQWHHLVAVFDRDSSLRVYVDNELDLQDMGIKSFSGHLTNDISYNLYAGRDNTGNPAKGYMGSLDDIRIYSYALGEGAILQLYEGNDNVRVSNEEEIIVSPKVFKLDQNYPNPFNPSTRINFSLEKPGFVELKVYDITGRLISTIVNDSKTSGNHSVFFNGANLASGIYIYELKANGRRAIKRFTFIK